MIRPLLVPLVLGTTLALAAAQEKKPADPLDGPPFVTAKAWAIGDGKTGELLWGFESATPRPIASTTKIMTAWIVLQLAARDARVLDEVVTFSERADRTIGSTAGVRAGEKLSVRELLYGLLLPSGNDAAVALAEHFGERFRPADEKTDPVERFVAEMNRRAQALNLKETKYVDPNGLGANHASARDLLRLTWTALQDPLFGKYVQTRVHRCTVTQPDGTPREITWRNTNQLLDIEGYDGVKTGTTSAAGACLVSSGRRGNDHLLVVVLGATSPDARYVDTRNLFRWAWLQRGHKPAAPARGSTNPE
ncbi:MAG TPA: D-alanyl-D-alanine carboxypeptidase family protein [Gemmataceae bacterium]|nr:D-alanyl-D-alanine carboxypeptidase family protein [Gemmataceae bacterium]